MARTNEGPNRAQYGAVSEGTGFLVSSEGMALTASHVVYPAYRDPGAYRLLAVVGKEFYGATVVCASTLPYDPANPDPKDVIMSRDVAEIRLTPSEFPFEELGSNQIPYARAHRGPLPVFPALRLAGADPNVEDPVRVLGFGRITSPLPYEWSAEGTVTAVGTATDGTPVFNLTFSRPAEPGDSGAPVLNMQDEVVGLYDWRSTSQRIHGTAIGRSALDPVCPP